MGRQRIEVDILFHREDTKDTNESRYSSREERQGRQVSEVFLCAFAKKFFFVIFVSFVVKYILTRRFIEALQVRSSAFAQQRLP